MKRRAGRPRKFSDRGVRFVAINSISRNTYSEDDFPHMLQRMREHPAKNEGGELRENQADA